MYKHVSVIELKATPDTLDIELFYAANESEADLGPRDFFLRNGTVPMGDTLRSDLLNIAHYHGVLALIPILKDFPSFYVGNTDDEQASVAEVALNTRFNNVSVKAFFELASELCSMAQFSNFRTSLSGADVFLCWAQGPTEKKSVATPLYSRYLAGIGRALPRNLKPMLALELALFQNSVQNRLRSDVVLGEMHECYAQIFGSIQGRSANDLVGSNEIFKRLNGIKTEFENKAVVVSEYYGEPIDWLNHFLRFAPTEPGIGNQADLSRPIGEERPVGWEWI